MKLLGLLLALFCSFAFSAHFTGTYFVQTSAGGITLTIQHESSGAMVGRLEGNGLVYELEGEGYPDGAFGSVKTPDGIFGYIASLDEADSTLAFYLLDLDQAGQPIAESAQEIILQRTSHQANLTPAPSTPTPTAPTPPLFPKPPSSPPSNQQPTTPNIPNFPKPSFPTQPPSTPSTPPAANTPMPRDPWLGTFTDGSLIFVLQGGANNYSGTLTLNGQSYPVKAVVQGNTLNGTFASGGNNFEFTASLSTDTLNLTTGSTSYTLERQDSNPLPSSPPTNPLLPGLSPPSPSPQGTSSLSGEAIELNKSYAAGTQLAATAAGVSFAVPQGYIGSYDIESATFVLAPSDQSHGISILVFSKATLAELAEYIVSDIQSEGIQVSPVDAPQQDTSSIRASYTISNEQGQLLTHVSIKQGQAGNAIAVLGIALPQQKDVLVGAIAQFIATVSFSSPSGDNTSWQQLLAGKQLNYTGNDSNFSSGGAGGHGSSASETKESYVFCSDSSYAYEYSSQMIFSTEAGSISDSDSNAHQGNWDIIFGLMADPILVLRTGDGQFFSHNLGQTANGVLLDAGVYSVLPSQICS